VLIAVLFCFWWCGCFERKKRPDMDEDARAKEELEKFQVD
jgi:hypothetical protein